VRHNSKTFGLEDTLATALPSQAVQREIDRLQEVVQKEMRRPED